MNSLCVSRVCLACLTLPVLLVVVPRTSCAQPAMARNRWVKLMRPILGEPDRKAE